MSVLGVRPGDDGATVRSRYRSLVKDAHPDRIDTPDAQDRIRRLTQAFAVLRSVLGPDPSSTLPSPGADMSQPDGGRSPGPDVRLTTVRPGVPEAGETRRFFLEVPMDEAFALLLEAAATAGTIGYVDRSLGLLEMLHRSTEGPTCSLLMNLEAAPFRTEVVCSMDSIEASPTPPIEPVIADLLCALAPARMDRPR